MPHRDALRSPLLSRFPAVRSTDLDEVRRQVAGIFCDHQLNIVGRRQRLDTRMHYRACGQLGYGRMLYGAAVDIDPGRLGSFFLLQIPLRGAETIITGSRPMQSTPRHASIVSPTLSFRMRHEQHTEKLFVRIDRHALERQFAQYCGRPLRGALEFSPGVPLQSHAGKALRQLLAWQFLEASDGTLFDQPLVAARLEETLMLSLLGALPHNQSQAMRERDGLAPAFVRRAEDYIRQHAHEALTAGAIAAGIGVSTRSLFAGFRAYRDTTPMAYVRTVRLEKVRQALCEPDAHTSVTGTALQWGFSHLGQFAAAYQRRYGELPSRTLRRSGAAAASSGDASTP